METTSTTQQANAHPAHHHPPNLFTLTPLQSPRSEYTSAAGAHRPPPDPLLEGPVGMTSPGALPASISSWRGGEDVGAGRGLLLSQGVGRNGPMSEDLCVAGGHGAWGGRGGTAGEFHGKDDYCRYPDWMFHARHGGGNERDARETFDPAFLSDGDKPVYDRSDSYESVYDKDTNSGCYGNLNVSFNSRDAFRQSSVDKGLNDGYLGRAGDPGSGQSSITGGSFHQEGEGGLWRAAVGGGGGYFQGLTASALKPLSSNGRYTQKLDSFSEAFQSYQRRGGFLQAAPNAGPAGRLRSDWPAAAAVAMVDGSQGCLYGSPVDSYAPSPSAFPSLPSLPSLASPPQLSQFLPLLLSPPPTPLPPSSLSPCLVDCSQPFGTSVGHLGLREGDTVGPQHFFLPHGNPQQSCDPRAIAEGNLRTNHDGDDVSSLECHSVLVAPESSFMSCSPLTPSFPTPSPLHRSRALGGPPLLHPSFHPAHLPSPHQRKEGHITPCMPQPQEVQSGSPSQSYTKSGTPRTYRGTPFPSVLHRREDQGQTRQGHYTPRPILDPIRQGAGLYITVASLSRNPQDMVVGGDTEEQSIETLCTNIGPDYQAELPTCSSGWEGESSPSPPAEEEASPWEQLLWKPLALLGESIAVQGQVERLLSMCNSSCLPGGGANTELALHCLHHCHGDMMATLEMLLFSLPTATGDYHYSGSDVWTEKESTAFSQGLRTLGKDFSLIQNMVTTKTVRQCVEFYYLGKRRADMQRRQTDRETDRHTDRETHRQREGEEQSAAAQAVNQQMAMAPQPIRTLLGPERVVPVTPLAAFFPCKMCGKMFYKIKSRNAHMKIHRQPQEDWGERTRLQPQLLGHRLHAPHSLSLNLGTAGLLLPQASPRAYSFPGILLPSGHDHGHPDPGVLNPFEATDSNSSSSGSAGAVDHVSNMRLSSTLAAFSNAGEGNPLAVSGDDVSDSAANQRGPPTAQSPVHQSWTLWMG